MSQNRRVFLLIIKLDRVINITGGLLRVTSILMWLSARSAVNKDCAVAISTMIVRDAQRPGPLAGGGDSREEIERMKTIEIDGKTWVVDDRNNRASVERWGSAEAAEKALLSCSGCFRCSDCSGCSRCSDCFRCSGCSDKSDDFVVPVIEDIHRKVYDAVSAPGALCMRVWHTCDTTHCRAGWVVHLAGEAGYELEKNTNTEFAAMQIYKASGYHISPVRFYDTDEAAMEDMRRLAERGRNA